MDVSGPELATILGITDRQVRSLADQGVVVKTEHGRYDAAKSVQGYAAHRVKTEVGRLKRQDPDDELKAIRIRREKLKLAVQERELIPLVDVLGVINELAGTVRLAIDNIPARYSRDLAERERLQTHIDEALTQIANAMDKRAAALRAGIPDEPPADD